MTESNQIKVYLDYTAGTPVDPRVAKIMREYEEKNFSHTSSPHERGREAKRMREDARFRIASHLGVRADECHFVYGATDGTTKAIYGVVNALEEKGVASAGMHIVMSVIEHTSVRACVEGLGRRGIKVTVVGVTNDGIIDIEQVQNALRPETIAVITMLVNNETGVIQPLAEIRKIINAFGASLPSPRVTFAPFLIVDASQAPLSLPVRPSSLGADMLVIDAHKFYGPFSIGLLYVKAGTPYIGLIGAQGKTGNEGTPDVAAILGMAEALDIAEVRREKDTKSWKELKAYFIEQLKARFPEVRIHGIPPTSVPTILNVSFPKLEGEFAVIQLDRHGIAASAKSACLSGGKEGSYVIQAMDPERANNSIRFSFGRETTIDDIDYCISVLSDIVTKR